MSGEKKKKKNKVEHLHNFIENDNLMTNKQTKDVYAYSPCILLSCIKEAMKCGKVSVHVSFGVFVCNSRPTPILLSIIDKIHLNDDDDDKLLIYAQRREIVL